jgi:transposase
MQVVVVKHNGKYFVTNNLSADKHLILKQYKNRWKIETMFRMLQYKLGIDECQMISLKAQVAHCYLSMMAFIILERTKMETNKTWYMIKRELTFRPQDTFQLLTKLGLGGA